MADSVASLYIEVDSKQMTAATKKLQSFEKESKKVESQNKKQGASFKTLSTSVASLAKSFVAFETIRRGAVAAVNSFAILDKGLIGVKKTTGIAGEELEALGRTIQDISTRVPVATEELLGIAQAAGQLGVKGADNIAKFTETVAMLGTASDLAGDEAATTLARLLTVTGEAAGEVDVLGSVIVALGNNMAATEKEIAYMATQVAQATAVFNVSSAEASALGGSAVGRAMRAISKSIKTGGDSMRELSRLTNMSGEELRKTFETDAVQVFQAFIEGIGRSGDEAENVLAKFGLRGEEILKVLPALGKSSETLAKALAIAGDEVETNTALYNEAIEAAGSFSAKMEILGNRVDIEAAKFGEVLAPAILEVSTALLDTVEGANALGKAIRFGWSLNPLVMFKNELEEILAIEEKLDRKLMAIAKDREVMLGGLQTGQIAPTGLEREVSPLSTDAATDGGTGADSVGGFVLAGSKEHLAYQLKQYEELWDARQEGEREVDEALLDADRQFALNRKQNYLETIQAMRGYEDDFANTQAGRLMQRVELEREAADEMVKTWETWGTAFEDITMQAGNSFVDFLLDGQQSFSDFANSLIKDIARVFAQIAIVEPIAGGLADFAVNALANTSVSAINSTINPSGAQYDWSSSASGYRAKDIGGWINEPVMGVGMNTGSRYAIAENGPELVSNPRRGQVGGSEKTTIVQHFNVSTGVSETVQREIRAAAPFIQSQTIRALDERNQRGRRR